VKKTSVNLVVRKEEWLRFVMNKNPFKKKIKGKSLTYNQLLEEVKHLSIGI